MQWIEEMLVHTFVTVQVTHLIWFVNDKRDLEWLNWKSIEVHIPSLISYNQLYKHFCNLLSFGQFKHFSYRVTCKKIGFLVLISITLSYQWFIKINFPVCSISRTLNSLEKNTILISSKQQPQGQYHSRLQKRNSSYNQDIVFIKTQIRRQITMPTYRNNQFTKMMIHISDRTTI